MFGERENFVRRKKEQADYEQWSKQGVTLTGKQEHRGTIGTNSAVVKM